MVGYTGGTGLSTGRGKTEGREGTPERGPNSRTWCHDPVSVRVPDGRVLSVLSRHGTPRPPPGPQGHGSLRWIRGLGGKGTDISYQGPSSLLVHSPRDAAHDPQPSGTRGPETEDGSVEVGHGPGRLPRLGRADHSSDVRGAPLPPLCPHARESWETGRC